MSCTILAFLFALPVFGINPDIVKKCVEKVYNNHLENERIIIINTLVNDEDNIWVNWYLYTIPDTITNSHTKINYNMYDKWYIQKFDQDGNQYFPPLLLKMGKTPNIINGAITTAYAYNGLNGDALLLGGYRDYSCLRVDNMGNINTIDSVVEGTFGQYFMDKRNFLYISSFTFDNIIIKKYSYSDKQNLSNIIDLPPLANPSKGKAYKMNNPYKWLAYDRTNYHILCIDDDKIIGIGPFDTNISTISDTTSIKVFITELNTFNIIDTLSFFFHDALWKKIPGCDMKNQPGFFIPHYLISGQGDTLLLIFGNKSIRDDTIYCCRITKSGKPVKSKKVIIEPPLDFKNAPPKIHVECQLLGLVTGICAPSGIHLWGFDTNGKIYYYNNLISE